MIGLVLSGTRAPGWRPCARWRCGTSPEPRKLSLRGTVTALASAAGAYAIWKIGPPIVAQTISVAANRVDHVTQSESATARYERSGTAMSHITDNVSAIIFGHGPEGHVLFLRTVGIPDGLAQTFDNSYLTLWYDSGIVGAAAFVLVAAMLLLGYRSLTGRMILGAFVAQILFFDFFLAVCGGRGPARARHPRRRGAGGSATAIGPRHAADLGIRNGRRRSVGTGPASPGHVATRSVRWPANGSGTGRSAAQCWSRCYRAAVAGVSRSGKRLTAGPSNEPARIQSHCGRPHPSHRPLRPRHANH